MKKIKQVLKNLYMKLKEWAAVPIAKYKTLNKGAKRAVCLVLAVLVALAGFGIWKWRGASEATVAKASGTSIVRRGNLTNSITGSGTVEPIEQREIVPEVNGKIIESFFNEGDSVNEGDVLYRFEMTAAENAIESAMNNVEKAQTTLSNRQSNLEKVRENISNLTIKATVSGKISGLSLRVGEDASGKICTITNFKEQTATIPFSSAQIKNISVGDSADIAIDKYMINTTGKVIRKYTAPDTLPSGAVVYYVEIRLDDKYTVEENVNVTATVNSKSGNIASASYGSVKYADPVTVNARQKGEVSKINFKNGDWVDEGQIIAVLKNSDLNDELRTAQQNVKEAQMNLTESLNNLEDKEEEANEYIVTSPISGVILTKDYFVGDTISGQNPPALMVVADMSKMKFTISADELDIAKIQVGQSVSVTADALSNQRLRGTITAVSKLGTASNGVTNYPIEVTIDQPGELMPGMNVSAQIIVEQSYNSLYLPVEAVEYYEGKYYVTVVGEVENMPEPIVRGEFGARGQSGASQEEKENNDSENKASDDKKQETSNDETRTQNPQSSERPNFRGERPNFSGERPAGAGNWKRQENSASDRRNVEAEASAENTQTQKENKEEKAEETKTTASKETEKNTKSQKTSQDSKEKTERTNDSKTNNTPGNQRQNQEELKIKNYKTEKRVEVTIGIKTDTSYEILSGVEYGQVVKNTAQVTQTGSRTGTSNRGGMGGFGGGMMGGMSGNNRSSNRNFGGGR
ncbi:MAG: HlyD family efflux transporter periplasmic adaptor subunit [Clostridia bacterium]|nr:HlyD family efflux transporter periplasmic adaptor subunit [Clostridia bacterium]